ncbi:MAG: helix-turn-helix domain-containing protein, partial [Gemmatimonadetes bacterium]|nr:helix-turn-helix transcriptional regulator [Gemmatimonadota bacterium]NIR77474.1 helix-turn-helix transcriptional regulator [Gemmatimonadota bacterium]NIT85998.1 helix-turn-helix transcriptional regulator [Gemmatimonadota bacterium]NIU29818.1 helix-turn-helix transcriptional regulator [Gemmatimonadota bacterium]NIU34840.1 helix-turn-helix domain-containing protein [Gemmatimonadota bacterium]
ARPPSDGLPIVLTHELEPALVGVVAREAEGLASGTEAVLKQLLTLVVLQALRAHLAELSPDELRALLSPEVARAVSYVHENLDEEIEVEDLCRETAMSRTVLTERFRDALGVSPIEYVRLARLSRAAEILQSSDWGLQRIARSVGYSSASTFSRAFRRRYGEPPGEYRTSE